MRMAVFAMAFPIWMHFPTWKWCWRSSSLQIQAQPSYSASTSILKHARINNVCSLWCTRMCQAGTCVMCLVGIQSF